MWIFLKALVIGIFIAIPLGPIGVLCVRGALKENQLTGLLVGLGAALADMIYCTAVGAGISSLQHFLMKYKFFLQAFGGVFLAYLAWREFKYVQHPDIEHNSQETYHYTQLIGSSFLLTATNPITLFSFLSILVAFGIPKLTGLDLVYLVSGVFLGSMTWWFILSYIFSHIKTQFSTYWLRILHIFSAILLVLSAVWSLYIALKELL